MKRNENLKPLSHDHYNGLVLAKSLKKLLQAGADPGLPAADVLHFWQTELGDHFRKEEDVLLPELSDDDELGERMLDEHATIRNLVSALAEPENHRAAVLGALAILLHNHIRFEERELFPHLERHVSEERLARIGAALHNGHECKCKCGGRKVEVELGRGRAE